MIDDARTGASDDAGGCTGRDAEVGELRKLAQPGRAVTLHGPAGIGKTCLLRRLAHDLAPDYPDGAVVVAVADLREPALLPARVAAAVGVTEEPGVPLPQTLGYALHGRRLLLALDGCEHVAGACAALCQDLLASAPGLAVLAASREALRLADGTGWPVPPLGLPPDGTGQPGPAAGHDAVRLFTRLAEAAAPGFALSEVNCAAVVAVCRALAGVPLGIELAAARLRSAAIGQIADGLCRGLGPSASDGPAGPDPGQALAAALDWSQDQLSPDEQVLLRRLSVFAGWSLEMAERVCADRRLPATRINGLLAGLARQALIEAQPNARGGQRWRMAGAVREYAAARLARSGEAAALHRRLRDYVLHVGDYFLTIELAQVPAHDRSRTQLFRRYRTDADNVRAVLRWCLDQGDIEAGLRMCTAFGAYWLAGNALAEGDHWFSAFLAADQSGVPASVRGPALSAGAWLVSGRKRAKWAAEGLAGCRASGNRLFTSAALTLLVRVEMAAGNPAKALEYGRDSVENARRCGDKWSQAVALNGQATAEAALGQLGRARDSAAAAVALMLEIDHRWGAARTMLGLADLERGLGNLDAARGHLLTALDELRRVKVDPELVRCLAALGRVSLQQGSAEEARDYLTEGMRAALDSGNRSGIVGTLRRFAALTVAEGRPDRAVLLAAAATALSRRDRAGAAGSPPEGVPARARRYLDAAASLGEAEVARLWAAGLRLAPADAAEIALAPPGEPAPPES
jgi:predicted ATPase